MQKNKLQKILSSHKKWLDSGGKEGKRANFHDTDLCGASLRVADLRGANLRDANLRVADLRDADLRYASLRVANLRDANLCGASLRVANLRGASLRVANLRGAVLRYANLRDADLRDANLRGADLHDADLHGAKLDGATMPDGKKWDKYRKVSVPKLLKAGGKKLKDVATDEHWNCHNWDNCPMAAAFDVNDLEEIPEKYKKDAATFVALFDAGLIPKPKV